MKITSTALTDTGLIRSVNQDDFYIDPNGQYFIVADGMGGHAGGQEASKIAVQTIKNYFEQRWSQSKSAELLIEEALFEANNAIIDDQNQHPERSDMGTTVVVLVFWQQQVCFSHVGDSRLYRFRDTNLEQITDDHTWVAKAMKTGDLSPEDARVHPWRHVLSQCLGRKDLRQIDVQPLDVQPGDRFLLCSDGLTEEVTDGAIAQNLQSSNDGDRVATALIEAAKKNGGKDNITVVLVSIDK